jgi:hypothetical protein
VGGALGIKLENMFFEYPFSGTENTCPVSITIFCKDKNSAGTSFIGK